MPSTTPIYALPYPVLADPADVPADILALANRLEVVLSGRYRGALTPAAFTALTGVADGDIVDLIADATNGVVWRLRYRAASASAYKWEVIGGSPLFATVSATETTTATTFVDLATVGPAVSVPSAGDYLCEFSVYHFNSVATAANLVSVSGPGSPPSSTDGMNHGVGAAATQKMTGMFLAKRTFTAAGTVKLQYQTTPGHTATFAQRNLRVQPIRVSQ